MQIWFREKENDEFECKTEFSCGWRMEIEWTITHYVLSWLFCWLNAWWICIFDYDNKTVSLSVLMYNYDTFYGINAINAWLP